MTDFITLPGPSSNVYIKVLTSEPNFPNPVRWDTTSTIKYFFDDAGFRAWSVAEKQAVQAAFAAWQKVANITFQVTTDRAQADIIPILRDTIDGGDTLGSTFTPADANASPDLNPIVIQYATNSGNFANLGKGGDSLETVIHEIGHSIGLFHPHDGYAFPGVTVGNDQDTGDNGLNQQIWTVMSYAAGWTGQPLAGKSFGTAYTPMAFDIAALQFLYGARAAETGDNVYTLPNANGVGTGWSSIWDTGGIDTISGATATTKVTIDLREAPLTGANAAGYVSWKQGIQGGVTIANGVMIENATGGTGNDSLFGNAAANKLDGGAGGDTMFGFAGNDTYYINSSTDIVDESFVGSNGSDVVRSSNISINLAYASAFKGNVESAVLEGSANLNLTGNALVNYLQGNNSANIFNGGGGSDTLVGLGGADTFRFANSLGPTNIDKITDYNVAQDRIELDNSYFTALVDGFLFGSAFIANATGLAADASDRIIYETDTGKLFYDSNGTAGGGTYQQFALLTTGLAMTAGEFFVI